MHDMCGEVCRKTLRFAHESENLRISGRHVELLRVGVLRNRAVTHHHDAISKIKRFFAVVGDKNTSEAQLALQTFQPQTQILTHLHVQRAERFIKKHHFRRSGQRPCQRYPLLLPTGQLRRITVAESSELHHFQKLRDLLPDDVFRRTLPARQHGKPKSNIIGNSQVLEERVMLEDKADMARTHGDIGHIAAIQDDAPTVRRFQPGDQAQQGRLAAAGRAQECRHLARLNAQIRGQERRKLAETLV